VGCSIALSWDDQVPVPAGFEEASARLNATTPALAIIGEIP
jgi:hypothetical protein